MEKQLIALEDNNDVLKAEPESNSMVEERKAEEIDFSSHFTTNIVFSSKDHLVEWIREVGLSMGMVIVIRRSDIGEHGKKARIRFACERNGNYTKKVTNNMGEEKQGTRRRSTGTKKCGCPFALKGQKLATNDDWLLEVVCGKHNHPLATYIEGHSYAGRLSTEQESLVVEMSQSLVPPRAILNTLKQKDNKNASTMRTIYNARHKFRVIERAGRSQIQQLMHLLTEHNYFEYHRICELTGTIMEVFWAHPRCLDLLRAFPCVLEMDCTYKTNKYRLPLLEIVGVTSTHLTFSVAYAYLNEEREDNYKWALSCLKIMMGDSFSPDVIVTDRELALIKAIDVVFPTSKHLLCRWHISKNVLSHCKRVLKTKEKCDKFYSSWNMVVYSSNEEEYAQNLSMMENDCSSSPYGDVLEYVKTTWLDPFKERFVSAWTDLIMHFGNNTTNRAESSHAKLKRYLGSSMSSFDSMWSIIHNLLVLQHTEIKASFERSMHIVQHNYKPPIYSMIRGFISKYALQLVVEESKIADLIGPNTNACECSIRRTHGLPCAHEIAKYKRDSRPIPISSIHPHWAKLDMLPASEDKLPSHLSVTNEIEIFMKIWNESDEKGKLNLKNKLKDIVHPASTSLSEPPVKCNPKGRPRNKVDKSTRRDPSALEYVSSAKDSHSPAATKSASHVFNTLRPPVKKQKKCLVKNQKQCPIKIAKQKVAENNCLSKYIYQIPEGVREYISSFKDVESDGNCGFRAIAELVGLDSNAWEQVRFDMLLELGRHHEHYERIFGDVKRVAEIKYTLSHSEGGFAPMDKWFSMPDMGHIVATLYNVVLCHFSLQQCLTFLPHLSIAKNPEEQKIIGIAFVNNNHYIEVFLHPGSPIPSVATNWYKFAWRQANDWETPYISRMSHFKKLVGNNVATSETVDLD